MLAKEIIFETFKVLSEIDMSPTSLRQLASQIDATAGMEFEMYVPDVSDDDGEEDYTEDVRVYDFDDIRRFFDNEANDSYRVDDVIDQLKEEYNDMLNERISDRWNGAVGKKFFKEWVLNNVDPDDIASILDIDTDADDYNGITRDDIENFIEMEWESPGRYYEQAYEEFTDDIRDELSEHDFLRYQGLIYMSNISDNYNLTWPYRNSGAKRDIKQVALQFMTDLGMNNIAVSNNYHGDYQVSSGGDDWRDFGGDKPDFCYTIEPDGSLDSKKESSDGGLEFVSNPLPLDKMLSYLNGTVNWARENGCYTNKSTGLHMNVSIPNFSREKLDFVKLALLLGDEYVLQQFGRESNSYTRSALSNVKDKISILRGEPEAIDFFNQMRQGLSVAAAKIIHSGNTGKYTSINTKNGYIEFRSPGGDWLNEDIPKLENTLLRFVVALDAACDPQKYRAEYLKKLYKVLAPSGQNDIIGVFARYAAGALQKDELKNLLKQAIAQRQSAKPSPTTANTQKIQQPQDSSPSSQQDSSGSLTGDWKIVNYSDEGTPQVLHILRGVGNYQIDANRAALRWLANDPTYRADPTRFEITVVPIRSR
jgi:hypothetical protein